MRLKVARADDAGFLTDVVVVATRDQGRWPAESDEAEFRKRYQRWIEDDIADDASESTTYVVLEGDIRIGRLRVVHRHGVIELAGVQLLPRHQGSGVGTAVVDMLKAEAAASEAAIELCVEKNNPRARALYERLGFVDVDETEDEHRMRWMPDRA